jgi:hypothetical protein
LVDRLNGVRKNAKIIGRSNPNPCITMVDAERRMRRMVSIRLNERNGVSSYRKQKT